MRLFRRPLVRQVPRLRLLRVAKENGIATFLVGHVTKDGTVAGPRVLEHLVDCVLQFEGDRYREHRVLRASKNRFGSTNELAVFEMTGGGLVGVPIDEPGAALAVALAIASAAKGAPVKAGTAAFGEVGLTGRLRPATQADRRVEECAKLGLTEAIAPAGASTRGKLRILQVETLGQAAKAGIDAERAEGA